MGYACGRLKPPVAIWSNVTEIPGLDLHLLLTSAPILPICSFRSEHRWNGGIFPLLRPPWLSLPLGAPPGTTPVVKEAGSLPPPLNPSPLHMASPPSSLLPPGAERNSKGGNRNQGWAETCQPGRCRPGETPGGTKRETNGPRRTSNPTLHPPRER